MRRRGTAAVLAMIFLVVFSALTAAFYTMTTTSVQVARNDRNSQQALAAAESGVAFIQRLVGDVVLPQTDKTAEQVTAKIYEGLRLSISGKATLGGQVLDPLPAGATSFALPAITLHANGTQCFEAAIEVLPEDAAVVRPRFILSVTGIDKRSQLTRTVRVNLGARDRAAEVFKYGVASKGRVDLAKDKSNIIGVPPSAGSIISAYPGDYAIYSNGATISGDVFVSGDPSAAFVYNSSSGAVGDVNISEDEATALQHVHQQEPPEFPEFTPNSYYSESLTPLSRKQDSTILNTSGGKVYANVVVTGDFEFGANDTIQGLIYVKSGVKVSFRGSPTIQGVIVVEDPPGDTTSTSSLFFYGVPVFQQPVWPATTALPESTITDLSGYSIMGPTAYIYVTGSGGGTTSPEHTGFARTVVTGTLEENGSGVVNINDGTLITMADTYLTGARAYSSDFQGDGIRIVKSAGYQFPLGGYAHKYSWVMDSTTYAEAQ